MNIYSTPKLDMRDLSYITRTKGTLADTFLKRNRPEESIDVFDRIEVKVGEKEKRLE